MKLIWVLTQRITAVMVKKVLRIAYRLFVQLSRGDNDPAAQMVRHRDCWVKTVIPDWRLRTPSCRTFWDMKIVAMMS